MPIRTRNAEPQRRRRGFTLVELLLVVVVLAILAAIAVPELGGPSERARSSTAAQNVAEIRTRIDIYYHQNGAYPPTLDPGWFADGIPENPYWPDHPTPLWIASGQNLRYPNTKHLSSGSQSTMWYNTANGRFFYRVERGADDAETVALFNRVNRCTITSIGQTK